MTESESTQAFDKTKPPIWFWVVSIVAVLWFLMDMSAFFMRLFMTEDAITAMPENQQHLFRDIPLWVNVVFACEVFGGLFGGIALSLRKNLALPLFVISILGTVAQTSNIWFLTDAIAAMGAPAIVMPVVALLICAALIVFTKFAISKRWIH